MRYDRIKPTLLYVPVAPLPPSIEVVSSTFSSLTVLWRESSDGGSPVSLYHVFHHREFGSWSSTQIESQARTHTLEGLRSA